MSTSGPDVDGPTIDRTRYAAIRHQLATMDVSSHTALFYRSAKAQRAAATAFLDIGLQNNERCLYVYDESDRGTLDAQFRAVGIDSEARQDAGDLQFVDGREFYLEGGFDPQRMISGLETAAEEALDEGYDGLRVAGENTWSFELDETFDSIIEFEASFERDCSSIPAQTLCQYNLQRFDETAIVKALRTHEYIIYRDTVCENPYYVDPDTYLNTTDPETNAIAVLEQTYDLSESRQAVRAHEQRLEVINRIFRHNIRNDMNILLNYLELFEEKGWVAEEAQDKLTKMQETLSEFIETSERARYIEQTLQDSSVASVDLVATLADVTADLESEYPAADIEVGAPQSVMAVADQNIDVAIEELCRNAIVHADSDEPTVRVDVRTVETPGSVRLTVENDGSVPESTRRAITEGMETQLEHSSGLGLWLVKWLVEKSYGELRLLDDTDRCRIQMQLPTTVPGSLSSE